MSDGQSVGSRIGLTELKVQVSNIGSHILVPKLPLLTTPLEITLSTMNYEVPEEKQSKHVKYWL